MKDAMKKKVQNYIDTKMGGNNDLHLDDYSDRHDPGFISDEYEDVSVVE